MREYFRKCSGKASLSVRCGLPCGPGATGGFCGVSSEFGGRHYAVSDVGAHADDSGHTLTESVGLSIAVDCSPARCRGCRQHVANCTDTPARVGLLHYKCCPHAADCSA